METRADEFVTQAREHLTVLEQLLLSLEKPGAAAEDRERLDGCLRLVHSLKGDAGFLGFTAIRTLANAMETALETMRDQEAPVSTVAVERLLLARDRLAEQGLVAATAPETAVRIRMVNTSSYCTAIVNTPGGRVTYAGDTRISGVPGRAAPVLLRFSDIAGSSCGALLPTGRTRDVIEGVPVTCIDNGMPVLLIRAESLGVTGYESPAMLDANADLKARIEAIRLIAGPAMGLGDVRNKVVPKVTLVAPAIDGGAVHTRTFIPRVCHEAIGVLGAVSVATACLLEGSVVSGFVASSSARVHDLSIEHPSGEFTVRLEVDESSDEVVSAALLRTARALFRGHVLIEESAS